MKLNYGWVVVAAGALLGCVAMGTTFSLAVFLLPISEATGWSRTGVSLAMTLVFVTMGIGGFAWGALTDRFGPKIVVVSGAILLGTGLALASRAETLLDFQLIYGIVVGAAAGSIFAPMMATVTGWFEKHRSLAVSLVSAGMGVAPMTVSPFASWLLSNYDWRTAQLTIALLAWALLIPTAFLVRRAPQTPATGATPRMATSADDSGMTVGQALSSPQFIVLAATFFACCAMHSGPIFHTISYAITCGVPPAVAVTIYSVEGLSGLGGRLIFGLAGDRFGAKLMLVAGLLIQAFGAGSYLFARDLAEFYGVAVVFGMTYAGVMPLYAVIAREYFPMRIMGTVFGAATMVSCLGMGLGPVLGGWVFDHFDAYDWLYIGSFAVGLGAAAIALLFPPFPSRQQRAAQAAWRLAGGQPSI
jgi:MFS family permease